MISAPCIVNCYLSDKCSRRQTYLSLIQKDRDDAILLLIPIIGPALEFIIVSRYSACLPAGTSSPPRYLIRASSLRFTETYFVRLRCSPYLSEISSIDHINDSSECVFAAKTNASSANEISDICSASIGIVSNAVRLFCFAYMFLDAVHLFKTYDS